MHMKIYKSNEWSTDVLECIHDPEKDIPKGYFKSKTKAVYCMLIDRLEKEKIVKRKNKIKLKINLLLEQYPECAI